MVARLRFKAGERIRIVSAIYPQYRYGTIQRFPISGKIQKRVPRKNFSAYIDRSAKVLSVWARRKGWPKGTHTTLLVAVEHVRKIHKRRKR